MLRTHWVTSSAAAKAYFKQTAYYASSQAEWLGKGAEKLGLSGARTFQGFRQALRQPRSAYRRAAQAACSRGRACRDGPHL